mmetsp:Transcript_3902/g.11758  ORF Transcript_3902/g.11758 Transcript_3902/m.11758 type:complete len:216 (+) Transcript_3902:1633-2280(+)
MAFMFSAAEGAGRASSLGAAGVCSHSGRGGSVLFLGQTSSAARENSSTSSYDLTRRTSSSSLTLTAESGFAGNVQCASAAASRCIAHIRIIAEDKIGSIPSAWSMSMYLSFCCIHHTGRNAPRQSLNAAAQRPAGEVNSMGVPMRVASSEETNAVSLAARTTAGAWSMHAYACSSMRKGPETLPSSSSMQIEGKRGMIKLTMASSPLQSLMPRRS